MKCQNEELVNMYFSHNIVRATKNGKDEVGGACRMQQRNKK